MRRILVPLDGSELAASIIPDALRVAGPGGKLVLTRVVSRESVESEHRAVEVSDDYLNSVAHSLRAEGVGVQTKTLVNDNVAHGIDEAITTFGITMVACATRGRSTLYRLVRGSIAWSALARSTVPVLLRHGGDAREVADHQDVNLPRRILVPLDGSLRAEKALPLAQELASEWQASLWLTQVVSDALMLSGESPIVVGIGQYQPADLSKLYPDTKKAAQDYLTQVAKRIGGEIHAEAFTGPPVYTLTALVHEWLITDVVVASHGQSALTQFLLGGVAYELVHHLRCAVIVIPAAAK